MTESTAEVFSTVTENVALPPGSGREVGFADFVTVIEPGTSVIATVASSCAETGLPSSSVPEAVTTSTCGAPGVAADRTAEGAAVAAARDDRLRHVARALPVEVAVHVIGEARDRDRVDDRGVLRP